MKLELINAWPDDFACDSFERCCGSRRWAREMAESRPFESDAALFDTAERAWWGLSRSEWLQAFGAHPRIGDIEALRAKFAATADWASREQAGTLGASEDVLNELAAGNRAYEVRFGFIFIVCATGKSAEEMLMLLNRRLSNDPEAELQVAAGEQMKIARIRLERIAP